MFVPLDKPLDIGRGNAPLRKRLPQIADGLGEPQPHLELVGEVAAEERAHDHGRPHPVEPGLVAAGILNRRVGRFEQHELQRIGGGDLLGWNLVPPPVVGKPTDKSPDVVCRVPGLRAGTVKGPAGVPAIGGHRTDGGLAAVEPLVERLQREAPGQDAAGTHDRDRTSIGIGSHRGGLAGCGRRGRRRHVLGE